MVLKKLTDSGNEGHEFKRKEVVRLWWQTTWKSEDWLEKSTIKYEEICYANEIVPNFTGGVVSDRDLPVNIAHIESREKLTFVDCRWWSVIFLAILSYQPYLLFYAKS